eukprot:scaffold71514_cov18-Tisochrysis_lutea.AAC.6
MHTWNGMHREASLHHASNASHQTFKPEHSQSHLHSCGDSDTLVEQSVQLPARGGSGTVLSLVIFRPLRYTHLLTNIRQCMSKHRGGKRNVRVWHAQPHPYHVCTSSGMFHAMLWQIMCVLKGTQGQCSKGWEPLASAAWHSMAWYGNEDPTDQIWSYASWIGASHTQAGEHGHDTHELGGMVMKGMPGELPVTKLRPSVACMMPEMQECRRGKQECEK